ncbi:very short patch repair endonuclease [Bradyrhizobium zhanjiangense]|uniref:Very short patch repair endonuclease n=1 Tax=Bradyrhizobium zhanjiangense TaxID=1325107 RepID=A0A4Q0Q6Z6_9BRAD|nr:very short patch repair endonuclease [Bradyrhizobium zhanjiangense]RXG84485.1 very short patch repair endonuclease [Bradyrhizobium zhanjiangense]
MADVLTPEQRRLNMSRIRGRNTKPEKALRSALHAEGLRFRIHRRDIPGCPDVVFPKRKIAIFVDGCFWHGCPQHQTVPRTNAAFWKKKLQQNRQRDKVVTQTLKSDGWTTLRFWEHDVRKDLPAVVKAIKRSVRLAK